MAPWFRLQTDIHVTSVLTRVPGTNHIERNKAETSMRILYVQAQQSPLWVHLSGKHNLPQECVSSLLLHTMDGPASAIWSATQTNFPLSFH